MINLSFSEADRVPSSTITSKVKTWNVAPGVIPSSYSYFRIRGGQGYIIGVPSPTAEKLLKEKDSNKLRKMVASMIIPEMRAARSGMASPGKMILLMQAGDTISQVTKANPSMGKSASELTTEARKNLGAGDFALPGRRYPIHDRPHARNALARIAQHGTSAEQKQVQQAVHARFPDVGEEKAAQAAVADPEYLRKLNSLTVPGRTTPTVPDRSEMAAATAAPPAAPGLPQMESHHFAQHFPRPKTPVAEYAQKKAAARIFAAPLGRAGQTITVHPPLLERVRGAVSGGVQQYRDVVSGRATRRALGEIGPVMAAHDAAVFNRNEMRKGISHVLRRTSPTPQQLADLADLRSKADQAVRHLAKEQERAVSDYHRASRERIQTRSGSVHHPAFMGLRLLVGGMKRKKLRAGELNRSEIKRIDAEYGHRNSPANVGNSAALLFGALSGAAQPIAPLGRVGTGALAALGHYGVHRFNARQWKKARSEAKEAGMPFLEQDRAAKVKEIYRALKREHPEMPAEMKARIAARQGKPGKQHQGPPYKGAITDRER